METSVLTLVIVAGLSGLYSGWVDWRTEVHDLDLPWWRRTTATVGLLTVTMQAFLFLALLIIMGGHAVWFRPYLPQTQRPFRHLWFAPLALVLLVLVALPCVVFGKSQSRRLLLASSVSFCVGWLYFVRM
jgi:hypothetical protein